MNMYGNMSRFNYNYKAHHIIIILAYLQATAIIMQEVIWNNFKSIQENFMFLLTEMSKMKMWYKK